MLRLKSLSCRDGNLFLKATFLTSKNSRESVMFASTILPAKAMRNCLIIFAFGGLLLVIFFAAFSHQKVIQIIKTQESAQRKQRQGPGETQGVLPVEVLTQKKTKQYGGYAQPGNVPDLSHAFPKIAVIETSSHRDNYNRLLKNSSVIIIIITIGAEIAQG